MKGGVLSAPSVVLVDPDALVRAGVRRVLIDAGFTVHAAVGDLRDGILAVAEHRPQLCLVDAPSTTERAAAIAEMVACTPATRVVVLTTDDRDDDVMQTLMAGGWGHLVKAMDSGRLPEALRGVLDDEPALARRHVGGVLRELRRPRRALDLQGRRPQSRLSEREWQVLDLLVDGCSTTAIAGRLAISAVTVRRHAGAAVRKLGAPDRRTAVQLLREEVRW